MPVSTLSAAKPEFYAKSGYKGVPVQYVQIDEASVAQVLDGSEEVRSLCVFVSYWLRQHCIARSVYHFTQRSQEACELLQFSGCIRTYLLNCTLLSQQPPL